MGLQGLKQMQAGGSGELHIGQILVGQLELKWVQVGRSQGALCRKCPNKSLGMEVGVGLACLVVLCSYETLVRELLL